MVKRGLVAGAGARPARPALIWGGDGAWSAAVAVGHRARQPGAVGRSPCPGRPASRSTTLMAVALGGFVVRMGLVDRRRRSSSATQPWVDLAALGRRHPRDPPRAPRSGSSATCPRRSPIPASSRAPAKEAPRLVILGIEFPPISHVIEWPDIFGSGPFAVNKVVLLMWVSVADRLRASSSSPAAAPALVPTGVQNVAESAVDFVQRGDHPADDGPRGPAAGRRSCSRCSPSSSSATSGRSSRSSRCR